MNTHFRNSGFIVLKLSAALAVTGALLGLHTDSLETANVDSAHHLYEEASSESISYSDCLWYTARNNGFYDVQKAVAEGQSDTQTWRLWEQFVNSTGRQDCGPAPQDVAKLTVAVAALKNEADQYFVSYSGNP